MAKNVKKLFFPGAVLLISSYLSGVFAFGMIGGYLGTTLFHRKIRKKRGEVKGIDLPLGKWNIHLHHWIMGVVAILLVYFFSSLSVFWMGICGGLIFHDLYTDKRWYKVVYKKIPQS